LMYLGLHQHFSLCTCLFWRLFCFKSSQSKSLQGYLCDNCTQSPQFKNLFKKKSNL